MRDLEDVPMEQLIEELRYRCEPLFLACTYWRGGDDADEVTEESVFFVEGYRDNVLPLFERVARRVEEVADDYSDVMRVSDVFVRATVSRGTCDDTPTNKELAEAGIDEYS